MTRAATALVGKERPNLASDFPSLLRRVYILDSGQDCESPDVLESPLLRCPIPGVMSSPNLYGVTARWSRPEHGTVTWSQGWIGSRVARKECGAAARAQRSHPAGAGEERARHHRGRDGDRARAHRLLEQSEKCDGHVVRPLRRRGTADRAGAHAAAASRLD